MAINMAMNGKERDDNEDDTDNYAHASCGDPGDICKGDTGRVGRIGKCSEETRQQISHAVGVERALDYAEVGSARSTLGYPLYRYSVADGLDRADQGYDHECRQERQERMIGGQFESGPLAHVESNPGRIEYLLHVVQSEGGGHCTANCNADYRRP